MKYFLQFITLTILVGCGQDQSNNLLDTNMQEGMDTNMQEGNIFLASNINQDGVIEVETGLQYEVIKSGNSAAEKPSLSDTISAHFHGTLIDGTVFWSSVDMNEPLVIKPSQLIPGCQKILPLMRIGDKWRVFIHPSLAYGEEGRPTIPPNSVLTFEIELLSIQ